MATWVLLVVLSALVPGVASAATWCVPGASIGGSCPKVSATIQGAIDAGATGDTIRVGPGNPAERIVVSKRVRILGLPGHLITDATLPTLPGRPLIEFAGTFEFPTLERLVLDVVTSEAGIIVPSTVRNVQFKGVQITSSAQPRPAYGLQVNESQRIYFLGSANLPARVAGFEVGIELNDVTWLDIEAGVVIEDNGVGLRVVHGKGQIFWNVFRNNRVGLETRGIFHLDTNSNDFVGNELGLLWGWSATPHPDTGRVTSAQTEFDHNDFIANDVAFMIQIGPGTEPADFSFFMTDNPGCSGRFNNLEVDGTVLASFKTKSC